jgi:hypothetical protein
MAAHFCNWAKPNEGLRTEELVAFMAAFPAIDLSWRIGKGLPGKDTAERLLTTTSLKGVRYCSDVFADRGFRAIERPITPLFVARWRRNLNRTRPHSIGSSGTSPNFRSTLQEPYRPLTKSAFALNTTAPL